MAANALKKITARAKQIYKKGGTWKGAIKKAGAEYRGGKKTKTKKRRRRVGATLSDSPRPAGYAIGRARRKKTRRRVGATLSDSPRPAGYAIGKVRRRIGSEAFHISHAKEILGEKIMAAELRKFKATTKRMKTKIQKSITALKSRYRKLC